MDANRLFLIAIACLAYAWMVLLAVRLRALYSTVTYVVLWFSTVVAVGQPRWRAPYWFVDLLMVASFTLALPLLWNGFRGSFSDLWPRAEPPASNVLAQTCEACGATIPDDRIDPLCDACELELRWPRGLLYTLVLASAVGGAIAVALWLF